MAATGTRIVLYGSCAVVAACNAASIVFTFGIVQAYENAEQKQNENNLKQERRKRNEVQNPQ